MFADLTVVKIPFHIFHTDVASLQYELTCVLLNIAYVKMPFHIVHTDVASLQYE